MDATRAQAPNPRGRHDRYGPASRSRLARAERPNLECEQPLKARTRRRPDRILFVVVVVKWLAWFCSPAAWAAWPGWAQRRRVGWFEAREWLVRRAGVRG